MYCRRTTTHCTWVYVMTLMLSFRLVYASVMLTQTYHGVRALGYTLTSPPSMTNAQPPATNPLNPPHLMT